MLPKLDFTKPGLKRKKRGGGLRQKNVMSNNKASKGKGRVGGDGSQPRGGTLDERVYTREEEERKKTTEPRNRRGL